jgi:hypothetical protein
VAARVHTCDLIAGVEDVCGADPRVVIGQIVVVHRQLLHRSGADALSSARSRRAETFRRRLLLVRAELFEHGIDFD